MTPTRTVNNVPDWLSSILGNPLVDKSFAVVLVFVLLRFMREDIGKLVDAITSVKTSTEALHDQIRNERDHQASRMTETREFMRELIRLWAEGRGQAR